MISSYLCNRYQTVSLRGNLSQPLRVIHGVPQGSGLGPLLFLILINDLPASISCRSILFADDTSLVVSDKKFENAVDRIELGFDEAAKWFCSNRLALNVHKTKDMVFTLLKLDVVTDCNPEVDLLGFTLDSKLTWNGHVGKVCKKLARTLYLLRKLKHNVSFDCMMMAYFAFFNSHITYGIKLWGHSPSVKRILVSQKKLLEYLLGLDHWSIVGPSLDN